MIDPVLQKIGFSTEEGDTYVALLQLGPQPASTIARRVGRNRTTVLVHLDRLVKRGFARASWHGRTRIFAPERPEQALDALRREKIRRVAKIEESIRAFSAVLPELTSIVREDVRLPRVTFYEGTDELKQMYADSLTSQTEILCLSSIEDLLDLFGKQYDRWYVTRRAKNGIPVRYIAKGSPVEVAEAKKDKRYLRESRHLPQKSFPISNEINIYDGKVSIITLKNEKIGLLIQSQEIYHSMKVIFELLWKMGK